MRTAPARLLLALVALTFAACGTASSGGAGTASSSPMAVPSGAVVIKVVADSTTIGAFDPKVTTAKVGQPVAWEFDDQNNPHTVTADDGSFDSGTQNAGFVFVHVFTKPGTYTYHCGLHTGMVAKVTVTQ